ncbi:MAG TPA: hypothetical protein VFU73_14750 [Actinocrinis sp.]|nr:hypothetical protein [Actinocrinis sp.]
MDSVERRFRGFQLLGALIPPAIVLGAVLGGSGGRGTGLYAGAIEAAALTILGVLLVLRRRQDSVLGALARSAMAMMPRRRHVGYGPPRTGPAPRYSAAVARFHLDNLDGGRYECVLRGSPKDGLLNNGDPVRVYGRRRRGGEIAARRVAVLGSAGGIPVAWIDQTRRGDFARAHRADRVALAAAALLVAGLAAAWLPRLI